MDEGGAERLRPFSFARRPWIAFLASGLQFNTLSCSKLAQPQDIFFKGLP